MRTVEPPYGGIWKVARVDESRLDPQQRAEVHTWMGSLGVDITQVRPRFVISQRAADGTHLLHLSRFVYAADGRKFVDVAADQVHTVPLVIEIDSYPDWLPAVGAEQESNGG